MAVFVAYAQPGPKTPFAETTPALYCPASHNSSKQTLARAGADRRFYSSLLVPHLNLLLEKAGQVSGLESFLAERGYRTNEGSASAGSQAADQCDLQQQGQPKYGSERIDVFRFEQLMAIRTHLELSRF